jgi:hypothetical protein
MIKHSEEDFAHVCYDLGASLTMTRFHMAVQRATEVAGAAMTLAQALGQKPAQSYAKLFNELSTEEVVQALARAHAVAGDPSDALAWAREIGSSGKVKSEKDDDASWAVQRRIHALMGVADGMLDRSSEAPPRSAP